MQENFSGVGVRIDARLKELKLKQADLCRNTNISSNAISQYVTGKRVPDTGALFKIATALSVSMEWLLSGENITTNVNTTSVSKMLCDAIPLNESEADLIAMYRFLDDSQKEDIYDYLLMKYEKTTGERGSVYLTYQDTNKQQKSDSENDQKSGHGIA